ncbi:MAG: glycosyltransferase [Chloroflexi bacterium]|nr:glycosyltransferase [Chloroflexota bacterium]
MTCVSVIIPAYNQGAYLPQAIQSVLNQSHVDFEVVVVDDGSTDDTREVAQRFNDNRVRYVYQENRGLSAARNTGMRNSSAPYLTFLDSDDLFLAEKLNLLGAALDDDPAAGFAAGQAIPVDENGDQAGDIFATPPPSPAERLLLGNPLHVGSVMLRRDWQERVGFFDESLRSYEDWDMWLRLAQAGCKMIWVDRPVSLYRFHTAQMTRIGGQMTRATFAVLDKVYAQPELPPSWQALRSEAYSAAHLRAAAQAYLAGDISQGQEHLSQAVVLQTSLLEDEGGPLALRLRSWIELPKTKDNLGFLTRVYGNLPEGLHLLRRRARRELAETAMQQAFKAYQRKEYRSTRESLAKAFYYQPRRLLNRGALAIFLRSLR